MSTPSDSPTTGLAFGQALQTLKSGGCVRRAGWASPDIIYLKRGMAAPVHMEGADRSLHGKPIRGVPQSLFELGVRGSTSHLPELRRADGGFEVECILGSTDLLAEDWEVV